MPRNTVDTAFVRQFESQVHIEYQRMGSKLRSMVRTKTISGASAAQFPIMGRGKATRKARNGEIIPMNPDHGFREVTLQDWYAGSWVDKLDEAKTNIAERQILAQLGAYALGRKTDEMITDALQTVPSTQTVGTGTTALRPNTKSSATDAMTGKVKI